MSDKDKGSTMSAINRVCDAIRDYAQRSHDCGAWHVLAKVAAHDKELASLIASQLDLDPAHASDDDLLDLGDLLGREKLRDSLEGVHSDGDFPQIAQTPKFSQGFIASIVQKRKKL